MKKTISIVVLIFVTGSIISCSEEKKTGETTEEVEVKGNAEDINKPSKDINPSKEVSLTRIDLPKLAVSIGIADGYTVEMGQEFGELISYAVKKKDDIIFYVYSKAANEYVNDGKFPSDPSLIVDNYDEESTTFLFKELKKAKSGNTVTGLVYQFEDDNKTDKRFEYFIELEGGNYIYVTQEKIVSNVDNELAMIYSIQKMK